MLAAMMIAVLPGEVFGDGPAHRDLCALAEASRAAGPSWVEPIRPVFDGAARTYDVPVELLLTLGKLGSAFLDRGTAPTIEDGYGVMALRGGLMGGDSLSLARQLTGVELEQLKRDPVANIRGAAAVLSEYARQSGITDRRDLLAWRPVIERFAGLDKENAQIFVFEVYDLLQMGFTQTNHLGEVFSIAPQPVPLDTRSLLPPIAKAAAPDYPPGTWDPAASCNYSTATGNKDTIVVHTIEGTAAGARSWFKNCSAQVSSQYVVSESGLVWQMVRESQTAWHAGCYNTWSIGIEHEGYAGSPSHPQTLYDASADLARDICNDWNIPKEKRTVRPGIVGHIDVTRCCCGSHTDPGNGWDWTYYINKIKGSVALDAQYVQQNYQQTMTAGSTATVWVEFRNTGTETWQQGQVKLGTSEPQDRASLFYTAGDWLAPNRPTSLDSASCAPGAVCRFTFVMTAPQQTGVYTENWRLLKENVAWFGGGVWFQINVVPPPDDAQFVSSTIPASLKPGQTVNVSVVFKNTGGSTWTSSTGFKLGAVGDSDPFTASTRISLAAGDVIAPGQQATFNFAMTAPATVGSYQTDWQMIHEGTGWFGPVHARSVTVSHPPIHVLVDDFESYAGQAAFKGSWLDTGNSAYVLDTGFGNPGKSVRLVNPSGNNLGRYYRNLGATFNATNEQPLTLAFDLYLDPAGAPQWLSARHYVELRGYSGGAYGQGTVQNILAIGVYNLSGDTFSSSKYQGRVLDGGAANDQWRTLDSGGPDRSAGWHRLMIQVTGSQVNFYVDGILSETVARPNTHGFDSVVIGSDLTAGGHTMWVDNLAVQRFAPTAPADFDSDGDVDQADFGRFQACISGPAIPQTDPACSVAMLDSDADVDMDDFAIFQKCISGSGVPADPACGLK